MERLGCADEEKYVIYGLEKMWLEQDMKNTRLWLLKKVKGK